MKFFKASIHRQKLAAISAISLIITLLLSGCSSLEHWTRNSASSLPYEIRHEGSGQILSCRAFESADRLYISGRTKEFPPSFAGHVDIQLIGHGGQKLAERSHRVQPANPAAGGGRRYLGNYIASFPLAEAKEAAFIRVAFHSGNHS